MRMAKALIAAVSLALVLVATVVVPLALTPGVYGFNDWPEATPVKTPRAQVVSVDVKARAERAPRRGTAPGRIAPARQQQLAVVTPAPAAPTAVDGVEQRSAPAPAASEPQAASEAPAVPEIEARDYAPPS